MGPSLMALSFSVSYMAAVIISAALTARGFTHNRCSANTSGINSEGNGNILNKEGGTMVSEFSGNYSCSHGSTLSG